MLFRLVLFLIEYSLLIFIPFFGLGYAARKLLAPRFEREKRRKLGLKNAKLLADHAEEQCFVCMKDTDPNIDSYDHRHGWYHSKCFEQLLAP